jgi:hypothetical protein
MKKTRVYVGISLHVLVATAIIFSAIIKFLELSGHSNPPEQARGYVLPLAIAELANALLLLIPRTMSVGILITSAGWGAVTALTLMQADDVVAPMPPLVPIGFLAMTWVGGYLRDSRMLFSLSPPKRHNSEPKP